MFSDVALKRSLAFGSSFLFAFSQGILLPLYPYLADQLNLSLSQVILCFSLGTLLFAFTGPFWSTKSERFGATAVLTIGVLGLFLSLSVLVFIFYFPPSMKVWSLALLLLSRIVYGASVSGINPVSQSLHARVPTSSSKPMILHSLCLNSGRLFGFMSLFFLTDNLGFIFGFLLVSLVLCTMFAFFLPREPLSLKRNPEVGLKLKEMGFSKKPFLVAFCFSIYLELINSSLAGRIQETFSVTGEQAAEQSALLFLMAVTIIVGVQLGLIVFKEITVKVGKFIGGVFLVIGGFLFGLFEDKFDLYLAICVISFGLAIVPAFNLADLKRIFGLKGYAKRAGWMASFYTTGYALGGALAAFAFRFNEEVFIFILTAIGGLLLFLCLPSGRGSEKIVRSENYG